MQLCSSLSTLWYCLSLRLEWKLIFSSPMATAEFSKFASILSEAHSQHHLLGFESVRTSNQSILKETVPWISIGRTYAEAEAPILWSPDMKIWLIGKEPYAGKNWEWEEKGVIEDDMIGWHHWLNEHEFVWTLGDIEGQGSLACCSPWGCRVSDTT